MKRIVFSGFICALIGMTGCGGSGQTAADLESLKEELLEADREFERRTSEGGAVGWAESFAEDGLMVQGSQRIRGRQAIRQAMQGILGDPSRGLAWTPDTAWASKSGDLGVTTGSFRSWQRSEEGEERTVASGTYITVWQRQQDGSWKVVLDGGSPDPQPSRGDG